MISWSVWFFFQSFFHVWGKLKHRKNTMIFNKIKAILLKWSFRFFLLIIASNSFTQYDEWLEFGFWSCLGCHSSFLCVISQNLGCWAFLLLLTYNYTYYCISCALGFAYVGCGLENFLSSSFFITKIGSVILPWKCNRQQSYFCIYITSGQSGITSGKAVFLHFLC